MARAPIDIDKHVGAAVRARRIEIGMSQEKLAELLDVTAQQVQKYEKGVNRIAASRLFDISRALRFPIAAFFPAEQISEAIDTSERGEWLAVWRRSTADQRPGLLAMAKAYIGLLSKIS